MSGEASSLTGISNAGGSKLGNAILGYLFDPANASGLFGKNQGPGAFMNPNGRGGALYPGGPGLPGGNATGGGLNDAAAAIIGGEFAGPALAGGAGSSAGAASGTGAATAGSAAPSSAGSLMQSAGQLASIANTLGIGKQPPQGPAMMQAQPRNSSMPAVQQPPLPSANPQPQSPGNLPGAGGQMQVQAATNPQLKQLLASLGIG